MATVAVIQARLGSTRFPRKVLHPLPDGRRMVDAVIDAARQAQYVDEVVLVTPDSELASVVDTKTYLWTGGRDVLGEFWCAANDLKPDTLVRLTADCPMLDGKIIDFVTLCHGLNGAEYTFNTHDDYPANDGVDVEVFSFQALRAAYELATETYDREHVTPYIRRHFKTAYCPMPPQGTLSVNTYDDYIEVCRRMEKAYGSTR